MMAGTGKYYLSMNQVFLGAIISDKPTSDPIPFYQINPRNPGVLDEYLGPSIYPALFLGIEWMDLSEKDIPNQPA